MSANIFEQASNMDAIRAATVQVNEQRDPSMTRTFLTGEPTAVRCKVQAIMDRYPSMGYGTWVEWTPTGAIVTRSNSCD